MSAAFVRPISAVLVLLVAALPSLGQTRAGDATSTRTFKPRPGVPNIFAQAEQEMNGQPDDASGELTPTQVWPPASAPERFRDVRRPYYPYSMPPGFLPPGVTLPPTAWERALQEAYEAGRADERAAAERDVNRTDMLQRRDRALDKHGEALAAGKEHLKAGEYAKAIVKLTLASKLNQGDAACRVHLAQARLALGQYAEAGAVLKRALQLQTQLVYHDLKLDRYYPAAGTLAAQRDALAKWMAANQKWLQTDSRGADVQFLRGFLDYQLDDFAAATAAFRLAARSPQKDDVVRALLEICQPATVTAGERIERR